MLLAAALLAVLCTPLPTCGIPPVSPCATPTPVIMHDQVPDADLKGYLLYYREPGGTWQLLVDWPCDWVDENDDGIDDTRVCRASDFGAPLQRYCPSCQPFNLYEFAVKAYDTANVPSAAFSNVVSVCFSPICIPPGPCN